MKELRTIGRTFDAKLDVYDVCKYNPLAETPGDCKRIIIHDVTSWEIVTGEDAEEIEVDTDGSCIDDYHEYLVLHLTNGETSTFRNSYVDLFTR